jgi:hypothetical protein
MGQQQIIGTCPPRINRVEQDGSIQMNQNNPDM